MDLPLLDVSDPALNGVDTTQAQLSHGLLAIAMGRGPGVRHHRERTGARLVTFGAGIQHCLGVNLARAELEEALSFLPSRMPELHIEGEPVFGTVQGIYQLDSLPLSWQ